MQAWQAGFQDHLPAPPSSTTRSVPAAAASVPRRRFRLRRVRRLPQGRGAGLVDRACAVTKARSTCRTTSRRSRSPSTCPTSRTLNLSPETVAKSSPTRSRTGTTTPSPPTTPVSSCPTRPSTRCTARTTPARPRTSPTTWQGRARRLDVGAAQEWPTRLRGEGADKTSGSSPRRRRRRLDRLRRRVADRRPRRRHDRRRRGVRAPSPEAAAKCSTSRAGRGPWPVRLRVRPRAATRPSRASIRSCSSRTTSSAFSTTARRRPTWSRRS